MLEVGVKQCHYHMLACRGGVFTATHRSGQLGLSDLDMSGGRSGHADVWLSLVMIPTLEIEDKRTCSL